jgi:predicted peroxiredoxin
MSAGVSESSVPNPNRAALCTEVRMAKFLFVLTSGLEDPSRATRCMQLAHIAKQEGHDVSIFLVDHGVIFAKKGMSDNIVAATGDEMSTYMELLTQGQVPIYA